MEVLNLTLLSCFIVLHVAVLSGVSLEHGQFLSTGAHCAGCSFGLGITMQLAQVHNESVSGAFKRVCGLLSNEEYHAACNQAMDFIGPIVIVLLEHRLPPDVICTALYLCPESTTSKQPACHLFPIPSESRDTLHVGRKIVEKYFFEKNQISLPPVCEWPGLKFFCNLYDNVVSRHDPAVDADTDGYSDVETMRGYAWRGRDCNEFDTAQHPGASPINSDQEYDFDCNGIYGVDKETGLPYETLFCKESGQLGVVLFGDSAGAHFHIPEQWLYPPDTTKDNLSHLPYVILNEFDWPMLSAFTGYRNITWSIVDGFTDSLYSRLRRRNLCNHRDYQNLGVNGADSGNSLTNIKSLQRNQTTDRPVLFIYEFIGNDVCNTHSKDTVAHMTTTEKMKENVQEILHILEERLPRGSHVLMMGLADGRLLYQSLFNRFHPLGRLNKNIRYPDFYEFMSCAGINPCNGWMTSNETLSQLTSQRAWELSQVIKNVVDSSQDKYSNFDISYIDCPLTQIYHDWEQEHGPQSSWQLIEPVDGFHPNLQANQLLSDFVWTYLEKNLPQYIGDVNPYNQKILDIFGDQGGH